MRVRSPRAAVLLSLSSLALLAASALPPNVLESDSEALANASRKVIGIPESYLLIRKSVVASIVLWHQSDEDARYQAEPGQPRKPFDVNCALFGPAPDWTAGEREAIGASRVIAIRQRRSLDTCNINELTGPRVVGGGAPLQKVLEAQCPSSRVVKCSEVRPVLEAAGFGRESIDTVMTAFTTRPFARLPDAGVPEERPRER